MSRKQGIAILFAVCMAINVGADDTVLLQYQDIKVTAQELQYILEIQIPPDVREQFMGNNERVRQMISDLYIVRQFAAEARAAGLESDPSVKFQMNYQADRVLMDRFMEKTIADAKKPDFENLALQAYEVDKQKFRMPEAVRASHILIKVAENRNDEQAKALAQELRERAVAGEDFAKLAAEHSDDPSAKQNMGDLGYFEKGRMVKEFADAAYALQNEGDISEVVKTQYGYHVIRLQDHRSAQDLSFDKVKAELIAAEEAKFAADLRKSEISRVKSIDGIQVNQIAVTDLSKD